MNKESAAYKSLCTEYYELDKPAPPPDAGPFNQKDLMKNFQ